WPLPARKASEANPRSRATTAGTVRMGRCPTRRATSSAGTSTRNTPGKSGLPSTRRSRHEPLSSLSFRVCCSDLPSAGKPHPCRCPTAFQGVQHGSSPSSLLGSTRGLLRGALDARGLRPLRSLGHLELDLLPLVEILVPLAGDGTE